MKESPRPRGIIAENKRRFHCTRCYLDGGSKAGLLTNRCVPREGIPEGNGTKAEMELKVQIVTTERMNHCRRHGVKGEESVTRERMELWHYGKRRCRSQ